MIYLKGLIVMRKKIMSVIMSSVIFASMAGTMIASAEVKESYSYYDIYTMTKDGSIEDLFSEKGIDASDIWTASRVSELLEKGAYPAVYLKPEKTVYSYEVFGDDGVHTVYEYFSNCLYENFGVPDTDFWTREKLRENAEDGTKAVITPISHFYGRYTERLAAVLNYIRLSPDFAGFYEEDMSKSFYEEINDEEYIKVQYYIPDKTKEVMGDVNIDGSFDIADLLTFKKWMMRPSDAFLNNWEAADFDYDDDVDVFDLILMRKALIEKS